MHSHLKYFKKLIKSSSFVKQSYNFTFNYPKYFSDYIEPPKFKIVLHEDITIAKRQVWWRIRNMGQLEIEVLLLRWYKTQEENLNLNDLREFTTEVLEVELPVLNKYLLQSETLPENSKYLKTIIASTRA